MDALATAYVHRARSALDLLAREMPNRTTEAKKYVRTIITRALNLDDGGAENRWGYDGHAIVKSAVAAVGLTDTDPDATAFLGLAVERSVIGRMQALRRVPFHTRITKITGGAIGYWVAEAAPRPLSRPALEGETLRPLTINSLIAATREALGNPQAEALLQEDLLRAVAAVLDATFLADDPGVPNQIPAGLANGAPTVAATGSIEDDLAALVAAFGGDLETTSLVTTPAAALRLALAAGGNPQIDVGPNGGRLFGFPLLTTRNIAPDSNGDRLLMIDEAGITTNVASIRLTQSTEATLAMADDPSSPAQMVSLFQTGTVALMATIEANWNASRAGSVAVLEGL